MSDVKKPKSVFEMLDETKTPAVEAPPAQATNASGVIDQNALSQLLQYLILKEGREAAASEQEMARQKVRQKQRDRNARDQDSKILLKQARCKHLKGGKRGPKTQAKDYAVYQHVFINFNTYIRCRICGMKWYMKDTADYLNRNGKEISNHTKIGWREAIAMTDASSDTVSKSEAIPNASPNTTGYAVDALGNEISPRLIDRDGQVVERVEM